MNSVVLIGRLTRDPELRYTSGTQMAVATFTVAIDRPVKTGSEKQADFPRVIVFGKQAESCGQYLEKGRLVGIHGRIQTGSYKRQDGGAAYTTDVVADRVEFMSLSVLNVSNYDNMQNDIDWNSETGPFDLN